MEKKWQRNIHCHIQGKWKFFSRNYLSKEKSVVKNLTPFHYYYIWVNWYTILGDNNFAALTFLWICGFHFNDYYLIFFSSKMFRLFSYRKKAPQLKRIFPTISPDDDKNSHTFSVSSYQLLKNACVNYFHLNFSF
jgi:hypothetical protein